MPFVVQRTIRLSNVTSVSSPRSRSTAQVSAPQTPATGRYSTDPRFDAPSTYGAQTPEGLLSHSELAPMGWIHRRKSDPQLLDCGAVPGETVPREQELTTMRL